VSYLERETLEIIVFDDNAPIQGVERGGRQANEEEAGQDMIGTVKIPLVDLIKGATIHDKFAVRNAKNENCGQLEVKISIMDLEGGEAHRQTGKQTLQFNKQWENDLVYRIAKKLARFPVESVELLFGIFARGEKTVSKEDFKYGVLQRLNLRTEITEKELELFLRSNPQIADRDYLDKTDFIEIFASAITQARHDRQNE